MSLEFHHRGFSVESYRSACAFTPRATDVIIATAPKTGTTLLQWACHLVRVGLAEGAAALSERRAGFAFDGIYQVAVWLQMAHDLGIDVVAPTYEQRSLDVAAPLYPRLFKSHQRLGATDRHCKRIVTLREPAAVARSWWRFLRSHDVPPLRKYSSVSDFVFDKDFFASGMRFGATIEEYYTEYAAAIASRDPSVLVLCFEDLATRGGVARHVPLLARFLGGGARGGARGGASEEASEEAIAALARAVGDLTTKAAMLDPRDASKFDESWAHGQLVAAGRNPDPSAFCPVQRVYVSTPSCSDASPAGATATARLSTTASTTRPAAADELNAAALSFLDERWAAVVAPASGARTYSALVERCRGALCERYPHCHPYRE